MSVSMLLIPRRHMHSLPDSQQYTELRGLTPRPEQVPARGRAPGKTGLVMDVSLLGPEYCILEWWRKRGVLSKLVEGVRGASEVGPGGGARATLRSYRLQNSEMNNTARLGTSVQYTWHPIHLESAVHNYYVVIWICLPPCACSHTYTHTTNSDLHPKPNISYCFSKSLNIYLYIVYKNQE